MRAVAFVAALLPAAARHTHAAGTHAATRQVDSEPSTVWLCGDSTMARGGGHNGTEGWGEFLQYSLDASRIRVNNSARAGRSARTFTREGRFQAVIDAVRPGDWAVIELGHNDGPLNPADDPKHRTDCPGTGDEVCLDTYDDQTETVQTFATYLRTAGAALLARGARVVLATPTPSNPYDGAGAFAWAAAPRAADVAAVAAALARDGDGGGDGGGGGGAGGAAYLVDHGAYGAQALWRMGAAAARAGFPNDATHMAPWLADVAARAFVLALVCGDAPLRELVVNGTGGVEGEELGFCLGGAAAEAEAGAGAGALTTATTTITTTTTLEVSDLA